MRDSKYFLETLKPILEDFGYTDANADLIWTPEGHKLVINTSVDLPNRIDNLNSREGLGEVIKALKHRLNNSNYLADLASESQETINTLEEEVDKLKEMLHNALELKNAAKDSDDKLSVL
jgi:hypothetical protein